jgi:5-oxoprolinase (ATP-hydrolysing)
VYRPFPVIPRSSFMNRQSDYEAWVDVGGTFTDCFIIHRGLRRECKLLSSGRVPVSLGGSTDLNNPRLLCPELQLDCDHFWVGATLRVYDRGSRELATYPVIGSSDGRLTLGDAPQDGKTRNALWRQDPASFRLELDTGLEAPVLAVRRGLQLPLSVPLPRGRIRLGTTRGTNALLTRKGARVALAITSPFEDLLAIGDQTRPDLFALDIRKPTPLAEATIGIRERLDAQGQIVVPLDAVSAKRQLASARSAGCQSLAICLMHGYHNPIHEQLLEAIARDLGFSHISCSHRIAPLIELVARAQTTVVDAYLSPIIGSYLSRLVEQFGGREQVQLDVMSSSGGLAACDQFAGKDSILSGPAGGAVALEALRQSLGADQLFGLDMGGTSTDVCRVSAEHSLQYESDKAGIRILTPTLPIETVAAGGGSICWFDGVALRVGPHSAGATPGPACYGRGGPLTLTDLNVFLGRLPTGQFPFPLDLPAIVARLDDLLSEVSRVLPIHSSEQLAEGFRRLANEQMASAVHTVSLAQGVDPRGATLVGFGGAAGQHICEIAELLKIRSVVDVPTGGLLSAQGMGLADLRADAAIPVYLPLEQCDWAQLDPRAAEAADLLAHGLLARGIRPDRLHREVWCELRYVGTDNSLSIDRAELDLSAAFHREHERRYGYQRPSSSLELIALRVECVGRSGQAWPPATSVVSPASTAASAEPFTAPDTPPDDEVWRQFPRSLIAAGQWIEGPAIVLNAGSTLTIDRGWRGECLSDGSLRLLRPAENSRHDAALGSLEFDPVTRDCLSKRFSSIARQMGLVLQQTAVSVNVKQRRDFSCALFDARGRLLANAPHVPVHLGAMGTTVRQLLERFPQMAPGDCFVTNDPYCGGSHLPDITVVTPIFDERQPTKPQMFVANRAHHADIGGIAPGSMSVAARWLDEEGVVIPPMRLVAGSTDLSGELLDLLRSSPYPPRNIAENMADLAAQQAANQRGLQLLRDLSVSYGWEGLNFYSQHLLQAAAQRIENFVKSNSQRFQQATAQFVDHLDDGTPIAVSIGLSPAGKLRLDFSGCGETSPTNFNANPSIVTAAVLYVLRCLVADDMPLNEGILERVELVIPAGILNPPVATEPHSRRPAVAAGNVETSQRIVDVLLAAFGAAAASQGTMNNLLFGNERFGFYETICGGAGGTATGDGASCVHTHMTNTRLTDPEILEFRYPIRLNRFGRRPGSGGAGRYRGGDGVIRELQFLTDVQLSLLTSRRGTYPPFGLQGGGPGQLGCNTLFKTDGSVVTLPSCCQLHVSAGDRLLVETPGGGGFGQ